MEKAHQGAELINEGGALAIAQAAVSQPQAPAVDKPVVPQSLIARRVSADPNHYRIENDKVFPLPPAFMETRAGGMSVDVFWVEGSTSAAKQQGRIADAAAIAKAEGHDVFGWTAARVDAVIQKSNVIEKVLHSETPTNAHHADMLSWKLFKVDNLEKAEAKRMAKVVAKILADTFSADLKWFSNQAQE